MADEKNDQNIRDFSKVILTLDNVLLPHEKLSPTPSMADGLDEEVELDLRILGCELIQTSGILLKLPQVRVPTGNNYIEYPVFCCQNSFRVLTNCCFTVVCLLGRAKIGLPLGKLTCLPPPTHVLSRNFTCPFFLHPYPCPLLPVSVIP